jgi:twitching motility protein PilT
VVNSLFTAIVRADGDALVMHVGERPYVVSPSGPVELSSRPLTFEAVAGMLAQLLPADRRHALDELGAIEHDLPRSSSAGGERFTVVAARGGNDIWIEIRRHRQAVAEPPAVEPPPEPPIAHRLSAETEAPAAETSVIETPTVEESVPATEGLAAAAAAEPGAPAPEQPPAAEVPALPADAAGEAPAVELAEAPLAEQPAEPVAVVQEPSSQERQADQPQAEPTSDRATEASGEPWTFEPVETPPAIAEEPLATEPTFAEAATEVEGMAVIEETAAVPPAGEPPPEPPASESAEPTPLVAAFEPPAAEPEAAVILPLARSPIRSEGPMSSAWNPQSGGLERLLRLAAARGASTLYLMSDLRPAVRLDGEVSVLEAEPVLSAADVASLLAGFAPEPAREALDKGPGAEWTTEVPEVGRLRCMGFRDHRGPGAVFRLITPRPATVDELGLSREVQALCAERDGLIVVASPRANGRSMLVSALVDLVNRTRSDYVITIENQVNFAYDVRGCLISQREADDPGQAAAAVRAALRENPDVLVVDDLRTPEVLALALDAAAAGRLVVGALIARSVADAIGRIVRQFQADRRARVGLMLSEGLRGVVAQVLVPKTGGGRIAAREVLFNTPEVASLIAEGRIGQLPAAIEHGKKAGMAPLGDALAAFVQSGVVEARDAYAAAADRQQLLAIFRREGVDTSFVERRA